MNDKVKAALAVLPHKPGVYLMHNAEGKVIYVGKAKNLNNRVHSYFRDSDKLSVKTKALTRHVDDIETIMTDTEIEALILECNLIKKYKPRYNIMLKDDKTYPYLKITLQDDYPRMYITRRVLRDGAKYYGPYPDVGAMRSTMNLLRHMFPIRNCKNMNQDRPCLQYHIKRCMAPCAGLVSRDEYAAMIDAICMVLDGKNGELKRSLKQRMMDASSKMEYELAARMRDQLRAVERLEEQQKAVLDGGDMDVVGYACDGSDICLQIFFVRGGKLIGKKDFIMPVDDELMVAENIASSDSGTGDAEAAEDENIAESESGADVAEDADAEVNVAGVLPQVAEKSEVYAEPRTDIALEKEVVAAFIKQYYNSHVFLPREIIVSELPEESELELLGEWLREKAGRKVNILSPQRGDKVKLLQLAKDNALKLLHEKDRKLQLEKQNEENKRQHILKGLEELGQVLNIKGEIGRMDCFDISHNQGSETVASMVVFRDGDESKKDYRRYKIQSAEGKPDDYKSMQEVVYRRYKDYEDLPGLIIIDGGKGQLNAAQKVVRGLGLSNLRMISLAERDEEIFLPGISESIKLSKTSPALHILQHIRDEAHRFAITYHRKRLRKKNLVSVLDHIEGIGPKRRTALRKAFPSMEDMRRAGEEELAAVDGMNSKVAAELYRFLHGDIVEKKDIALR